MTTAVVEQFIREAGLQTLDDSGTVLIEPDRITAIVDDALKLSLHISIVGRTANDKSGKIIAFVSADKESSNLSAYQGEFNPADLKEGIFSLKAERLLDYAEVSRKQGFAMRIISEEAEKSCRVQVFKTSPDTAGFPQDFWIERLKNEANLSEAVMGVLTRRS